MNLISMLPPTWRRHAFATRVLAIGMCVSVAGNAAPAVLKEMPAPEGS
jgi:hypothetical protein